MYAGQGQPSVKQKEGNPKVDDGDDGGYSETHRGRTVPGKRVTPHPCLAGLHVHILYIHGDGPLMNETTQTAI